ncbi:MAG: hypothetical protein SW833_21475 [Cyanobacteriota bacterium]|nr:hypothetical protein [Cyanobacteriota bacterium]
MPDRLVFASQSLYILAKIEVAAKRLPQACGRGGVSPPRRFRAIARSASNLQSVQPPIYYPLPVAASR